MKPSGVFISLGRGDAVDEVALRDALRRDAIAGAALDVFKKEPLPSTSDLWTLGDKILITSHNADLTEDYFRLGWEVFAANNRKWAIGDTDPAQVAWETPFDPKLGY